MSKIVYASCCFSWTGGSQDNRPSSKYLLMNSAKLKVSSMEKARSGDSMAEGDVDENDEFKRLGLEFSRRSALSTVLCLASTSAFGYPGEAMAVVKQGLLAGRVPGLSEPDEQGWRTYQRPEDKSGGHGVGWSPIIPYKFSVPQDWDEVPVSIADLGGTEIDLRFGSVKEGRLFVIVAPVKRFSDSLSDDTNIEEIGAPEKVINAFGPEVIGDNVEGKVLSAKVTEHSGRKYYQFELEPPHVLITATAAGNRLYLFNVTGNGLQWKRHYNDLKRIADSFRFAGITQLKDRWIEYKKSKKLQRCASLFISATAEYVFVAIGNHITIFHKGNDYAEPSGTFISESFGPFVFGTWSEAHDVLGVVDDSDYM